MIKKVAFTMYPVSDLQRARNFYEQTLGLKLTSINHHKHGGSWIEYDLPSGGCFAITDMVKELKPTSDAASIAFEVDDLDKMIERLKKNNIKFKFDDLITPVCKMAVIFDSEGNSLILHQLTKK